MTTFHFCPVGAPKCPYPRRGAGANQARGGSRGPGAGGWGGAAPARGESRGPVPVSRRPGAESRGDAGEESLALPGRVPGGRQCDRLGDAHGACEFSPRSGAAARAVRRWRVDEHRARGLARATRAEGERRPRDRRRGSGSCAGAGTSISGGASSSRSWASAGSSCSATGGRSARYGIERVLIAYDADEAGDRGAEHVAEELARMEIECYRVHFPRGMDANAYPLAHAPASESLAGLLRGATWLGRPSPLVQSAPVETAVGAASSFSRCSSSCRARSGRLSGAERAGVRAHRRAPRR